MQVSSKLLSRTAIVLLGVLIAMVVFVAINNAQQAGATNTSDLAKVKTYVASYITNQFGAGGNEGEDGFIMTAAQLNSRMNTVGPGDVITLGEGDDAANAPVLVDNFSSNATWIPGTTNRCFWNTGAAGVGVAENCFNTGPLAGVKAKVDAHKAAGFSTDIVVYCVSGHTEAPTTGAFGYIAQTGGLASDGSIPKVYALKWGRNGWTNTATATYTNTNTIAAAEGAGVNTPPTSVTAATACNSTVSDYELMRCQAQWAIYSGTVNGMTGGNISNGVAQAGIATTIASDQTVDIRTGSANTVNTASLSNIRVPIDTIFGSGLASVNPTTTTTLVSRTPMVGGIVAEGMKMLGYTMRTGGFVNGGIRGWKNTEGEAVVSDGLTRPGLGSTAIDAAAPTITGVSVPNVGSDQADVVRTASEAATSKIALTGSDGHVVAVNNTVLNAYQANHLSGLHPGVTYSGTVTSYDGQANGTTASIPSFTTVAQDTTAPVVTVTPASQTIPATGPSGATASYSASAVDAVYGPVAVSCDIASGSMFAAGTTTTVTCTATDPPGNLGTGTATVTVDPWVVADTTGPSIDSIVPSGYVLSENANISVYYSDAGSEVDVYSVFVTMDGNPITCTAVTVQYASCPQTMVPQGARTIGVTLADTVGNSSTGSGAFFVDTLQPTIASGYYPGNNAIITNASPTITLTPTDRIYAGYTIAEASGPNVGATTVLVDGSPVSCTNNGV
ncbi:MAG: HYR domain-containing protein, partial [Thermoleophilia bacterium]|nr:HYR domain-containing protein [Thermoleophilia bacterium]